jgi:hypothetical protein
MTMEEELSKERLIELYLPPTDDFVEVDVPRMKYFMVDGEGSPDDEPFTEAVKWLFAAVYPIKRVAKKRMGRSFVEPPLEGLWWADDLADFVAGRRDRLKWRLMIPAPNWADEHMFAEAVAEAAKSRGAPPASLRLDSLEEGRSVQIMYVGPYQKEAATLARRLHEVFLPAHGLAPNGRHHEIYLSDPRRTTPEKQRTVLRQPVRACPGGSRRTGESPSELRSESDGPHPSRWP